MTDTMDNLLSVVVHAANIHDTVAGLHPALQAYDAYPTIMKFCGDDGYRRAFENDVRDFLGWGVDISEWISPKFTVIPVRWVVERTLSWLSHSRRLSKDYEYSADAAEAFVAISNMRTLLKRFTHDS